MRQRKFYFLIFILCAIFNSTSAFGEVSAKDLPISIEIRKDPSKLPRTPDYGSNIMAFYQDGVVYLQFVYDMGDVEITVTNESTGEQWQQTEDTAFGSASIATSTSAGDYYITIITNDAICYSGSFSL